jgi:hypothetical protein
MGLFDYGFINRKKVAALNARIEELVQGQDILRRTYFANDSTAYTANDHELTHYEKTEKLIKMYFGIAQYGNQYTQRIVDLRAAFAFAQGLYLDGDKKSKEYAYLSETYKANGMTQGYFQRLAKEKEFEGQTCILISWPTGSDYPKLRYLSYYDSKYQVTTGDYYDEVTGLEYEVKGKDGKKDIVTYEPNEFAVMVFNGRMTTWEGVPNLAGLTRELENLDKILIDWRASNNLFGRPTPYFRCTDQTEVAAITSKLAASNWKVGNALAATPVLSFEGPTQVSAQNFEMELITVLKIISGGSGVPIMYLGFPEFNSNRSTAEQQQEPVDLIGDQEREIWIGGFNELNKKILEGATKRTAYNYDNKAVTVGIKTFNQGQLAAIQNIYLPLFLAGKISQRTFLKMLPAVGDVEEEIKSIEAEQAARIEANAAKLAASFVQ